MALAPGPAAVFRIVPPSDKVALGETVRRALSASSTPRVVFGGGDARRRLARRAPRWSRVAWGLLLASLAASLLRQLGARCLSSSLAPPQDRENCHVCGISLSLSLSLSVCVPTAALPLRASALLGELDLHRGPALSGKQVIDPP